MRRTREPDEVTESLRQLLPPGLEAAVWEEAAVPELYPEEALAVARAVHSRRLEFACGRACARRALAAVGAAPGPIPVGKHREPIWPDGFVGSITHCEGLVAAVAGRRSVVAAVGIDAEPARPLPAEVRASVLRPMERRPGAAELETVIFSAKESIHKVVFPSTGVWLDFQDVELTLHPSERSFTARGVSRPATDLQIERLQGRYAIAGGYVLTLGYLPGG